MNEFVHRRGGAALARLVGLPPSCARHDRATLHAFTAGPGLPTIGVLHSVGEPAADWFSSTPSVNYWALGGSHARRTVLEDRCAVQFSGSPQGRSPEETGLHGCELVSISEHGAISHRTMVTDLFRWRRETVAIDETTSAVQLRQMCRDRLSQIVTRENDVAHLVCWTVQGNGPLARRLRREGFSAELLEELRSDYGYRNPAAWSDSLDLEHSEPIPAECYRQEDFLGDYLRAVRQHQQNVAAAIDLSPYVGSLSANPPASVGEVVERVRVASGANRQRLLEQAARLGVDLLRPLPSETK
jgi:hypothetical protein